MKKNKIHMGICGLLISISLFFWIYKFGSYPFSLSGKSENWSNFGSFIGGVIGPILSFISIILVLENLKLTEKNHNEQIDLVRKEQNYIKFSDFSTYIQHIIKKSVLGFNQGFRKNNINIIKELSMTSLYCGDNDNPTIGDYEDIVKLKSQEKIKDVKIRVDDIAIALQSLMDFILQPDNEDVVLMKNMIEINIEDNLRFFIYQFILRDHQALALRLDKEWPSFGAIPWPFPPNLIETD